PKVPTPAASVRGTSPRFPLGPLLPAPRQRRADRLQEDLEVHPEAHVLDVEQVVLELLADVLEVFVVAPFHLREAGDPGLYAVPPTVDRDGLGVLLDEGRALGRSEERRVAQAGRCRSP